MDVMNPVIGLALIVAILNLGAPLDYHLIFGAGIYTAVYIVSRAIGKYSGAYIGAARNPRAGYCAPLFGLYAFAALGRFAGVYRHCRIHIERPGPGVRLHHTGYHCGGGGHQRNHSRIHCQKGFEWAGEIHKRVDA